MIEELVTRVFATRNIVHLAHWKIRSGFHHEVLGELYGGLIDGIDSIVESYQGQFNTLIGNVSLKAPAKAELVAHLREDLDWITENEEAITKGNRALGNLVQALCNTYQSALNKLVHYV